VERLATTEVLASPTENPSPSAPAPFLKTLKAPRPAAPANAAPPVAAPAASAPRASAPAEFDELDASFDAPSADENFESATTVVPRSVLADRDVDRDAADDRPASTRLKPPPPLDDVVANIPAETKDALEQLFRARFRTVRRITPEQLR